MNGLDIKHPVSGRYDLQDCEGTNVMLCWGGNGTQKGEASLCILIG